MPEGGSQKKQTGVQDLTKFLSGGIAGCVSRTSVAPLERLKILMQVQEVVHKKSMASSTAAAQPAKYNGVLNSLRTIVKEEGWTGLYRGNGVNCMRVFPYTATQFFCFDKLQPMLMSEGATTLTPVQKCIGGATAGVISVVITYPLDFIRARLTVQSNSQRYKGVLHCLRSVVKQEGFFTLYRGISPSLQGVAPYTGLNFMVFETLKENLPVPPGAKGPDPIHLLGVGAVAGACGQTVAYPFDLLRRRMQMLEPSNPVRRNYSSTWGAFGYIVRTEGVRGLYKGIAPNFIKVVPSIAVMFFTNEMIKRVML